MSRDITSVGVAGFEPTASSSRTLRTGRLEVLTALAELGNRMSERWDSWSVARLIEATTDGLRTMVAYRITGWAVVATRQHRVMDLDGCRRWQPQALGSPVS